jgi:hypothetical protein
MSSHIFCDIILDINLSKDEYNENIKNRIPKK